MTSSDLGAPAGVGSSLGVPDAGEESPEPPEEPDEEPKPTSAPEPPAQTQPPVNTEKQEQQPAVGTFTPMPTASNTDIPATGDNFSMGGCVIMMAIGAGGMGYLMWRRRRDAKR